MSEQEKDQLPISSVISDCINCLETSNKLLNTYHKDTPPGEKKRLIGMMLEANSTCLVNAMEYQASEVKEIEENYIGWFVAIPVENYEQIILAADAMLDLSEHLELPSLKLSMKAIISNLKIDNEQ
jgi:hypothetical protein